MNARFFLISFSLIFLFSHCIFALARPADSTAEDSESIEDAESVEESEEIQFAAPDETSLLESGTKISIRTEKSDISVFINSNFQGKTPLTIKNLIPGTYILKIGGKKFEIEVTDKHYDKYFF